MMSESSKRIREPLNHPHAIRYLPSRGYPASAINRSRSYSELGGSYHSGFSPDAETHASREDPYQAGKRRKVDNRLIVASKTAVQDYLTRHRVPDNLEKATQVSYPPKERFYQDRQRDELVDNRFIPVFYRYPHYTVQDTNMGETRDSDNSFPRDNRDVHAMMRKPRTRESNSASFIGDKQPLLLWRPGDNQRLAGSNQHILGYPKAPYPRNRLQDERRHDIDNTYEPIVSRQPISRFHTDSVQRDTVTYDSKTIPQLLWAPEDKQHLTDLHCFVRKYCIYIFCATHQDVENPRKGRKMALRFGQIGIGCLHCKNSESKLKGSTYFPTSLSGIYNATMIIQQRHFPVCPLVSREAFCMYNQLKTLTARSASTKEYWISSARKMGLYDTTNGVFFRSNDDPSATRDSVIPQQVARPTKESLVSLVELSDKRFATEYSYFVMEQMTTCVFTESDRLGKRKCHKVGFPGMACRHCYGGNGSGRFFPLTVKTFSDVSKSIHVLRNHLMKCTKAPIGLAAKVKALSDRHIDEKLITPFGSQKTFFDRIWKRLHPELSNGSNDVQNSIVHPPPLPPPPLPSPPLARAILNPTRASPSDMRGPIFRDLTQNNAPHESYETVNKNILRQEVTIPAFHATTPLPHLASPPVVHRGKLSSRRIAHLLEDEDHSNKYNAKRRSRELCMIPKKRYLFCQGQSRFPSSYTSSPPQPLQEHVAVSHSESDVSIAMILANGFGKSNDDHREPDQASV